MEGELPAAYGWLIAGGLLIALEAFGIPGIGFLFAGLAAIVVGILVQYGALAETDMILQLGVFGGLTGLLAALLWKRLKQWRVNPNATEQFSNIVGDIATVGKGGLQAGKVGQVSWSGTTMMALIDSKHEDGQIEEGTMVEITSVKGNHLIVAPQAK